jgi:hypothetical protein
MFSRRTRALVAALPIAAVLLASCSAAPAPAANPVPGAPAAPAKDTAAACSAEVALNETIPPGADPDSPAPSASEMQAWATSIATPFATLRDNAPDSLSSSTAVLGGLIDQAKQGKRIDVSDDAVTKASNAVDGWVHDSCGYQTMDLTSTGGKLGPAPAALKPGPVSIKFSSTGDVVGAAQPSGTEPGYGTATVKSGKYLLVSPLGQPPNFTGTTALDVTVN